MRLLSTGVAAVLDDGRSSTASASSSTRSDHRHGGGRRRLELLLVLLEQLLMLLMVQIDGSVRQGLAGEGHPIVHVDEGWLLLLDLMLGNDDTGIGARLLLLLLIGIDQFDRIIIILRHYQ